MLRARLALVALLASCGAPPAATTPSESAAPSTSEDPPSYVPSTSSVGTTGEPVGIVTGGATEQARGIALALLRGLHEADATAIEERLAAELAPAAPSYAQPSLVLRRTIVDAILEGRSPGGEGLTLGEMFDLARIRAFGVADLYPSELPIGIEAADVAVEVIVLPAGQRVLRNVGRAIGGRLVLIVRPGPDARVVSLR